MSSLIAGPSLMEETNGGPAQFKNLKDKELEGGRTYCTIIISQRRFGAEPT